MTQATTTSRGTKRDHARTLSWVLSLVLLSFLVGGGEARASTCDYTGASGGDWHTAANWSCNEIAASGGGGPHGAGAASGPVSGAFVGSAGKTGSFIAVVAGRPERGESRRGVVAYVCDGKSVSAWYRFPRRVDGNTVELRSKTGAELHATLTRRQVTGSVELPGKGTVQVKARRAKGVAGLYLLDGSIGEVRGFSAVRNRLRGTVTRQRAGRYSVSGTVVDPGGTQRALKGSGLFFGSLKEPATWIVQPNGRVRGQAGGGGCSVWSSIKSALFGVHCRFF